MPMHRNTAIRLLGGSVQAAAKHLRCNPNSIGNWRTDKQGNLTSRRVVDSVIAAVVRKRAHDLAAMGVTEDTSGLDLQQLLD